MEHTKRIEKTKMNNNKNNPRPIIIKFARDSYRKEGFLDANESKREKTCNNKKC